MKKPLETVFQQSALTSRLLTRDQLEEAWAALGASEGKDPSADMADTTEPHAIADTVDPPFTDKQLADKLIEMGLLNAWQASQLMEGRSKFNLGPYRVLDSIGRGGMGQVFKGKHEILGRVAAIKVLPREKSTPEAILNFTREIRAQARLDHENLVRAFDAGTDGNVYYLVTEYVPGTDLRKLVRKSLRRGSPLTTPQAAGIISQVAAGLKHAHEQGLIHRDVKPGNILVTPDGHAKLSDLGLAGPLAGDAENDARFGKIVGTADYLSPDHIQSPWDPTPAWDIYSLGCTLYYTITGKVPFPHGSTADKARAHCQLRPLDPRRLNPDLDAEFVEVVADMLAKDPAERIASAAQVIARLAPWVHPTDPTGAGEGSPRGLRSPDVSPTSKESRPAATSSSAFGESKLQDTKPSFSELPDDLRRGEFDAPGESSQTTTSLGAPSRDGAGQDGATTEEVASPTEPSLSLVWPLLILVILPLGLVGLVLLIGWLLAGIF